MYGFERKLKKGGWGHAMTAESSKKSLPCIPWIVVPIGKILINFLTQLWIQDVTSIFIALYTGAYTEEIGIVWVDEKEMRCQGLPFCKCMKSTGLDYRTEEQKNIITSQLNDYYEIFFLFDFRDRVSP